jgi:hypothetical protein
VAERPRPYIAGRGVETNNEARLQTQQILRLSPSEYRRTSLRMTIKAASPILCKGVD